MQRLRKLSGMTVITGVAVAAITFLLVIPLVVQALTAVRGPYLPFGISSAQWGMGNFSTLYSLRDDFAATLTATIGFVGGAAVISVAIGWALAWLVVRTDLPGRNIISVLVVVPYIIPPIVKAQAFLLMLAPETGILNQILRALPFIGGDSGPIDPFAFSSLVVVQGLSSVTFPFLLFVPILTNMDGALEEASRISGASWAQTLRRVTFPMLWPATLGVIALSCILLLGTLEVPLLFGQQSGRDIFALKLWNLISSSTGELPQYGLAAAWGLHFLLFTSLLFIVYLRATRDAERRASVSGKGFRPSRLSLGRWRTPSAVVVVAFLVLTAGLPLLALVWASLTPFPMGMTLDNLTTFVSGQAYGEVLADPEFWASLGRTVMIGLLSATIAVSVATVLAFSVARGRKNRRNRLLDLVASSSIAVPASIAGFAFFILFLVMNKWIPLAGTIWALVLAYSYRVSIAYRLTFSATLQIKKELEEAAAISGASRLSTFRRIVLPLLLPAMAAVWIQLFILGTNEFTLAAFLATPESRPLSMYLYARISPRAAQLYQPDQGAAMAMIFIAIVLVIGYGLQVVMSRRALARTPGRKVRRGADSEPSQPSVTEAAVELAGAAGGAAPVGRGPAGSG